MTLHDIVAYIFSQNNSKYRIDLFDAWHFLYLFIVFGGAILLALLWRNKTAESKEKLIRVMAVLTIGLYIADFFCMPLSDSYNGIGMDKLPFHICTLMGVCVPFVQFNKKFATIKDVIVSLSVTSSVMWMCYPGSALGGQPPFCYLTFQTFMFHGVLYAWGFLNLALGAVTLEFRRIWRDFVGVLVILVWAAFGNAIYPNEQNWFFIHSSIFAFLPDDVMPPVVVFCVCGSCFVVHCVYYIVRKLLSKQTEKKPIIA